MMGVSVSPDTSLKPELKDKWSVALSQLSKDLELMSFLLDNQFKCLWLTDEVYIQM